MPTARTPVAKAMPERKDQCENEREDDEQSVQVSQVCLQEGDKERISQKGCDCVVDLRNRIRFALPSGGAGESRTKLTHAGGLAFAPVDPYHAETPSIMP